jgi:hypothetical protein
MRERARPWLLRVSMSQNVLPMMRVLSAAAPRASLFWCFRGCEPYSESHQSARAPSRCGAWPSLQRCCSRSGWRLRRTPPRLRRPHRRRRRATTTPPSRLAARAARLAAAATTHSRVRTYFRQTPARVRDVRVRCSRQRACTCAAGSTRRAWRPAWCCAVCCVRVVRRAAGARCGVARKRDVQRSSKRRRAAAGTSAARALLLFSTVMR